jgi:hypothetical protein
MSNSVSRKELALCKRRGHEPHLSDKRQQCPWCGIWLRTVTTIEEREDEPPEEEQEPTFHLLRMLNNVNAVLTGKRPEETPMNASSGRISPNASGS